MQNHRLLKIMHFAGTLWFVVCALYILILALRQAGFHWWIIFSLSGHSIIIFMVLLSLYLFAIFRGVGKSQSITIEHPLTSTNYYMTFYVSVPFLGLLVSLFAILDFQDLNHVLLTISMGTLGATFLTWVIVDPIVGMIEMLAPESRKHYAVRMERIRLQKEEKKRRREMILKNAIEFAETNQRLWQQHFANEAEKLAEILSLDLVDSPQARETAVDIGVKAWQQGGLYCMQEVREMALNKYKEKTKNDIVMDCISFWWDGIGTWKNKMLV